MADHGIATTSMTLLGEVCEPGNAAAWERFAHRYQPLIARWCRQTGLQPATADDICQEVLLKLFKRLKSYDPRKGLFRSWLKQVVRNAIYDFRVKATRLASLAVSDTRLEDLAASLDESKEFDSWADDVQESVTADLQEVMARVQKRVEPETWETFRLRVLEEHSTTEVAAQLGIPIARVHVYKGRILKLLRAEWVSSKPAGEQRS